MPDDEPDPSTNPASSSSSSSSSSTEGEEGGTPSSINQKHAAAIGRAEDRARAAQKGAYAPALAAVGLPADFATNLLTACAQARAHLTTAQSAEAARNGDADALRKMRELLVGHMQQVQAWARGELFFSQPSRLSIYHIGERLDANADSLEQFSLDVRTAGMADQLPGLTPAFLESYNAVRTAVFGPENPAPPADSQTPEPEDEAIGLNATVEREVREVTHAGMRILFLADGVWPHWKEGSAGPRHAFGLPTDRPYAPTTPTDPDPDPSAG